MLICPTCQSSADWISELDRCPVCLSMHLVRRLGEVECRDCGHVGDPSSTASAVPVVPAGAGSVAAPVDTPDPELVETPGLAEEVELALARVLGRAGRPARIG